MVLEIDGLFNFKTQKIMHLNIIVLSGLRLRFYIMAAGGKRS
jgi:hypothetical protein